MLAQRRSDQLVIRNVTLHELDIARNSGRETGGQIIDDHDAQPSLERCPYEVRANESGAAGDQDGRHGGGISDVREASPNRSVV